MPYSGSGRKGDVLWSWKIPLGRHAWTKNADDDNSKSRFLVIGLANFAKVSVVIVAENATKCSGSQAWNLAKLPAKTKGVSISSCPIKTVAEAPTKSPHSGPTKKKEASADKPANTALKVCATSQFLLAGLVYAATTYSGGT